MTTDISSSRGRPRQFNPDEAVAVAQRLFHEHGYDAVSVAVNQPAEATRVMAVLDQINARWGRGTLRAASVPSKPD